MKGWIIVNKLREYFHPEWAAMTVPDWVGMIMTIAIFLIMIALIVYVLHPSNKEKLEAQRYLPIDDDHLNMEVKNERAK